MSKSSSALKRILVLATAGVFFAVSFNQLPATAATPPTPSFGKKIDAYAKWEKEKGNCGADKKGTVALAKLLKKTYNKKTGTKRACGGSGHSQGRAIDIMISRYSKADRAKSDALLKWLLATDKHGNKHAMARRLGVMYIIHNNKIWRSYGPRGWGSYHGCKGSGKQKGDPCHRGHIHISLSWAGANKKTSYWTAKTAPSKLAMATNEPVLTLAAKSVSTDGSTSVSTSIPSGASCGTGSLGISFVRKSCRIVDYGGTLGGSSTSVVT